MSSLTGISGLKPGYEKALEQAGGPHLQVQIMLKKEDGSIAPDTQAYIFRNSIENIQST